VASGQLSVKVCLRHGRSNWQLTTGNWRLCFRCRLLLLSDRAFARTLAGAGIRMGALSANRQIAAVTESAIRTDFDEPLDVHRNVFAQIAFDAAFAFDDLADAVDFVFRKVLNFFRGSTFAAARMRAARELPMP
jgi:hypothetical protein